MTDEIRRLAERAAHDMHRHNSEIALQSAIELMLTDHSSAEVIAALRTWADYLEERK